MSPSLKLAFALSLLLNASVLGGAGYRLANDGGLAAVFGNGREAHAAEYLKLSAEQRDRWRELEADFMTRFHAEVSEIALHRERLIREIFSEKPYPDRIEAERETIARLQIEQQRRVIAQLLREREILEPTQRRALADFLLRQGAEVTAVEQVHRQRQ